jgi:hypothetical protein
MHSGLPTGARPTSGFFDQLRAAAGHRTSISFDPTTTEFQLSEIRSLYVQLCLPGLFGNIWQSIAAEHNHAQLEKRKSGTHSGRRSPHLRHPDRSLDCEPQRVRLGWEGCGLNQPSKRRGDVVKELICALRCRRELHRLHDGAGRTVQRCRRHDIGLARRLYQGAGGARQGALFLVLCGLPRRVVAGRQRQSRARRNLIHEALGRPVGRHPVRILATNGFPEGQR